MRSSPVCGEKKQSADEPGFVLCGAKCSSFIWMCRRRHILSFYPPTFLRRESNEPPSNVGLHELSASEVHGLPRHHGNRWALTPPSHPYRRAVRNLAPAVIFFCTSSPSQTTSHQEAECPMLPGLSSRITRMRATNCPAVPFLPAKVGKKVHTRVSFAEFEYFRR